MKRYLISNDYLDKKQKIESGKKKKREYSENNSKRRLVDPGKPHYLENPYSIDIKWDFSDLKILCN